MFQYNKIGIHSQLKKIADVVKNKNGTTTTLSNKIFNKDQLLHELYLTER